MARASRLALSGSLPALTNIFQCSSAHISESSNRRATKTKFTPFNIYKYALNPKLSTAWINTQL